MEQKLGTIATYVLFAAFVSLFPIWKSLRATIQRNVNPRKGALTDTLEPLLEGTSFRAAICVLFFALLSQSYAKVVNPIILMALGGLFLALLASLYRRKKKNQIIAILGATLFFALVPWWILFATTTGNAGPEEIRTVFGIQLLSTVLLLFLATLLARKLDPNSFPRDVATIFSAITISLGLAWWRIHPELGFLASLTELIAFFILFYFFTTRLTLEASCKTGNTTTIYWPHLFFSVANIALSFNTGTLNDLSAANFLWHHWGAYIGPSQLVASGAQLFKDIPTQYGLGPTVILAAACRHDCWTGMYYFSSLFNMASGFVVFFLAISTLKSKTNPVLVSLVGLICLLCCHFWNAYPPNVASPLISPSVSGLRFLPALLFAALLVGNDRVAGARPPEWGHLVWAIGVLWAPESACYVTLLWWPYYLWRRTSGLANVRIFVLEIGRAFARMMAAAFLLGVSSIAVYYAYYQSLPSVRAILVYLLNPPGLIPVDFSGAFWFSVLALLIGFISLKHSMASSSDSPDTRRAYLMLLLSYGAYSYYLGRSHNNNILNLLPFFSLLLLNALQTRTIPPIWKSVSATLLGGLIALSTVFGWHPWAGIIWQPQNTFGGAGTVHGAIARIQPPEASWLAHEIHRTYAEPATLLDPTMNLLVGPDSSPWNAIHAPANFKFIPSSDRRTFLGRTARNWKKTGWLIVSRAGNFDDWLSDYDSAYKRDIVIQTTNYYAIRFVPYLD